MAIFNSYVSLPESILMYHVSPPKSHSRAARDDSALAVLAPPSGFWSEQARGHGGPGEGFGLGWTCKKMWETHGFLLEHNLLYLGVHGFSTPFCMLRRRWHYHKKKVPPRSGWKQNKAFQWCKTVAPSWPANFARIKFQQRNLKQRNIYKRINWSTTIKETFSRIIFPQKNSKSVVSGLELQGTNWFPNCSNSWQLCRQFNNSWTRRRTWGSYAMIAHKW